MNISMNAVCLYGVGLPKFSQNGGSWYQNEQYRICLELTPDLICLAIQNNIEGILIAEYGPEQGAINSADMLSAMIDQTQQFERSGGLSGLGVIVMDEMFKSLAGMTYGALSQGTPIATNQGFPVH